MKKTLSLLAALLFFQIVTAQQLAVNFVNVIYPCLNDGSLEVTVTAGGTPPYSYLWQVNGMVLPFGTAIATNLTAGYYSVMVTDANNFVGYATINLHSAVQTTLLVTSHGTCPAMNGSISCTVTGGTAPYDYIWSNGQQFLAQPGTTSSINNLPTGFYSITVTDANGCSSSSSGQDSGAYIYNAVPFTVGNVISTPSNCNDGTLSVTPSAGGALPYTYYWNTNPVQTTATATNLNGNTYYQVVVTDNDGCSAYGYGQVAFGPQALQATFNSTSASCGQNNGSVSIAVTNGNSPYTYLWNTGSTTNSLSGVPSGNYTVTITDNSGCTKEFNKYINEVSVYSNTVSTTWADCNNTGGTITVNVSGGTPPYSYLWSDGQVTSSAVNVGGGYYYVTITDVNGCTGYAGGTPGYDPACLTTITGSIYDDVNSNCITDPGEPALLSQVVDLGSGLYASTSYSGTYSYSSPVPASYSLSYTPDPMWNLICPAALPVNVSVSAGQTSVNNFFITPSSINNDLQVYTSAALARPGFMYYRNIWIYNKGNTILSGTVDAVHDPLEILISSSPLSNYNAGTQTMTFTYNNLAPYQYYSFYTLMQIPASVIIGTSLNTSATVYPVVGDINPADNIYNQTDHVVGSYDPNDKLVDPAGQGANGIVSVNDSILTYTIRFQNTGNYPAENIVVKDTLDEDFDISSFHFIGASHYSEWSINGPRVLTFSFPNINLPDSNNNEAGSHGQLRYSIKRKNNVNNTQYTNTAYIYFDFNEPVVTNTTLNTIVITGIKENDKAVLQIYPNPASGSIYIVHNNEKCELVEIESVSGSKLFNGNPVENKLTLPKMDDGLYIIRTYFASGIYCGKLLLQK